MQQEKKPLDWGEFMSAFNGLDAEDQVLLAGGCNLTYLYAAVYDNEAYNGMLDNMCEDENDWSKEMVALRKLKTLVDQVRDENLSLADAASVVTTTWAPLAYEEKKEFVGHLMEDEQFRQIVEDVIYGER